LREKENMKKSLTEMILNKAIEDCFEDLFLKLYKSKEREARENVKEDDENEEDYEIRIHKEISDNFESGEVVDLYAQMEKNISLVHEHVKMLLLEYTEKNVLAEKLFTIGFLMKELELEVALSVFNSNYISKKREMMSLEEYFRDDSKWIVRVVICEMKSDRLVDLFNNKDSNNLIHAAIQIGPYLIDWMPNSELRIRIINDKEMLYLDPSYDAHVSLSDGDIKDKIIEYISAFRYNIYSISMNDSFFVDIFLNKINIIRKWSKNGGIIRKFLSSIGEEKYERNNYQLTFLKHY